MTPILLKNALVFNLLILNILVTYIDAGLFLIIFNLTKTRLEAISMFQGYAASEAKAELKPFEYEPGALEGNEVQIKVETCGICHSDLSMLNNDWGISKFPLVPGHEVIGTVELVGEQVKHLEVGQRVGVGWFSNSCMNCEWCVSGDHNLCGKIGRAHV